MRIPKGTISTELHCDDLFRLHLDSENILDDLPYLFDGLRVASYELLELVLILQDLSEVQLHDGDPGSSRLIRPHYHAIIL